MTPQPPDFDSRTDGDRDPKPASFVTSPFDAARHEENGREFWLARELSKILGYYNAPMSVQRVTICNALQEEGASNG